MLVIPDKRRIVINSSENAAITGVIPHAKSFTHNGDTMVAMPYGVEEAIVLRNIGLSVPAPILHYYDWPARFPAMAHQKETSAFLTMNKRSLCLNAPGTGKTLSAIWAADFLINEGIAKKVLIIAPLSTLRVVWGRELMHHLPHRSFAVATGSRAKRLEAINKPGVQYVIINHDGFTNMAGYIKDFDVVIYDECTAVKSASSMRYKVLSRWLSANDVWLWLLTGTPISQNPTDAWTLAKLVNSPTVPKSFTTFKDTVMQKVSTFRWIPRATALDECRKVLQPSIRFSLDECKDLPATNFVGRKTELTPQQDRLFKEMQDKAVAVLSNSTVTAANAAVALSKLLQISCGVAYGDSGTIELDGSTRYNTFTDLVDEIGGKVIVFCPLRGVQDWLEKSLKADGYDVASVHGGVGKSARDQIFNDFQHTDSIQVLLAHPRVAAHGLTLTRAKDIIWFAPIYSLEQYEQANARIRRLSTEGKTTVWHIWATAFEAELYRRLRTKQNTLAEFLKLVRGINEDQLDQSRGTP